MRLPICESRRVLLYLVERYQVVVVVGHTGCGKTTQIPQYLHQAGWTAGGRVVACTQPRRVAVTSVARRVAEEMGEVVGGVVGYAVRFDERFDHQRTRVKYLTDGMLLRELLSDPLLSRYSALMIDEAHERSLNTDVLLGLLRKVLRRRPELRLLVSSATVDAVTFRDFFETSRGRDADTATVVSLPSHGAHPVDLFFLEAPIADYVEYAVQTVSQLHAAEPPGDILLFLTGQQEVEIAVSQLADRAPRGPGGLRLLPLPIYAGLHSDAQRRVFEPSPRGCRKAVVATNIAETSITIDGVVCVVDCGFTKLATCSRAGQHAIVVTPESRANARQRAGRSGRVRPGKCYALMTEARYAALREHAAPEMARASLAGAVLQLKALGIDNVLRFEFLSPPPPAALARALELLYALGALGPDGGLIEPRGRLLAQLPLEPAPGAMLLGASDEGCVPEALTLAAMLAVHSPFASPRPADAARARAPFAVHEGDALTLLNVHDAWVRKRRLGTAKCAAWCRRQLLHERVLLRAAQVRAQLARQLATLGVLPTAAAMPERGGTTATNAICRAVARGYFASAAEKQSVAGGGGYRAVQREACLALHPNSVLFRAPPDWIVFHETVLTTTQEHVLAATRVEGGWLSELAPHFFAVDRGRKRDRQLTLD